MLQLVHLHALNPFFPQTCRQTFDILHHSSPGYVARYLLTLYAAYGPNEVLVRALRHPVCTLDVAKEIKRIWDLRRGVKLPTPDRLERDKIPPETPRHSRPPLRCPELPRRVFRAISFDPAKPIDPLILYLFEAYSPLANSHKGYALCRAVLTDNIQLAKFLLARGADPSIKACLAVDIAIQMRNLPMVKLLVERQPGEDTSAAKDEEDKVAGGGRLKRRYKRPKLMDRIVIDSRLVELAMKKGAEDVVEYFVHEKGEPQPMRGPADHCEGVMPPLASIMRLGDAGISPSKVKKARLLAF